jgi:mannitol 2-dehydrogenase
LAALPGRIDVPAYDRAALTPAVVHLGVGGFHRAHQAMYLDDLARRGDTDWGEVGVGLRSTSMRDALTPQDCLYTVVQRGHDGDTARAVGSMIGYRHAPDDHGAVIDLLASRRTRLVTLTITGDGYHLDGQGELLIDHQAVRADLARPRTPGTAAGLLVEALDRRRRAGLPGLTVLSCDNLPDNGASARAAVLGLARLRRHGLAAWIDAHVSFPASMVDRITPRPDDATRRFVADRYGVHDQSPVVTEPFSQWIVEDDFRAGRPPLEEVGVQFVNDVTPYKVMKTRLLNGSHCALAYLATLAGPYRTTSAAMANPAIASYLRALMREEIMPLLPPVPGVDLDAYQRTLLDRFANPRISDQLSRLAARGSTKMPAYLLPSLIEAREQGRPATLLTLAVAAWFCYLRGYDLAGTPIDVQDTRRDELRTRALAGGTDPRPLLADRAIFGPLGDDPGFVTNLERALTGLLTRGACATTTRAAGP